MILNGKKIDDTATCFGVPNRAFQYGDGLFETVRFENGQFHLLALHFERLKKSCQVLDLVCPFKDVYHFAELLNCAIDDKASFARCKIFVWRKQGGLYTPTSNKTDYCIHFASGKKPKVEPQNLTFFNQFKVPTGLEGNLKTLSAICYVQAAIYAKKNGFHQSLLCNTLGEIIESEKANIFFGFGNEIYTPPLSSGCLDGVMRKFTVEFFKQKNIKVYYKTLTENTLKNVDWLFLTNATTLWQPAKAINGHSIKIWDRFYVFCKEIMQLKE